MSEVTVLDDYELLNSVATGNSTTVWEVKQRASGQTFAMKLLLPEAFTDAEQKKALKHEFNVGKSLDHPNIIRFFDLVMGKKHGYFVMEYFRSVNLKQMLRGERAAAQARARKILESVAQAMAHMHEKNWVHKDLKPENILVTKGSEVKVIDFSLASRPAGGLTKLMGGSKSQIIQGTRTYIAPELVRRKPLTFAADIYSLGITAYEILTGRPPFIHRNPNELLMAHVRDTPDKPSSYNSNVTPEADAFVLKLLSKKPEQRPASMQEVFAEVRNLKLFKEEPEEYARLKAAEEQDRFEDSMANRLDSRSDASRDRSAAPPPPKPKPAPPPVVIKSTSAPPAPKPAAPPPPAAAVPPGYPTPPPGYAPMQYPPGYPQQPMPYYPPGMPPQGWPQGYPQQQMPPGYPYPQGYPPVPGASPYPGALPPGAMPPGAMPPGAMPSGAVPGQAPGHAAAPPPAAAPQTAPPAAPPAIPAAAPPQQDEDDLPMMTELPEVM